MENIKLERVLNLLLGVSWSLLTVGTISTSILLFSGSTIFVSIIGTFSIFFFTAILVLFLESLKIQIKQNREIGDILKYIKDEKDSKSVEFSLEKDIKQEKVSDAKE